MDQKMAEKECTEEAKKEYQIVKAQARVRSNGTRSNGTPAQDAACSVTHRGSRTCRGKCLPSPRETLTPPRMPAYVPGRRLHQGGADGGLCQVPD